MLWGGGEAEVGVGNPRAPHPLYDTLAMYAQFCRLYSSAPGCLRIYSHFWPTIHKPPTPQYTVFTLNP